jgi:hypothetical protein
MSNIPATDTSNNICNVSVTLVNLEVFTMENCPYWEKTKILSSNLFCNLKKCYIIPVFILEINYADYLNNGV